MLVTIRYCKVMIKFLQLLIRFYSDLIVIGVSLNEPHISDKNGTSDQFTRIYVEIWINGTSVMDSQKFMFENQIKKTRCYQHGLLTLHIRLIIYTFITQRITRIGWCACSSHTEFLLLLVICDQF